MSVRWMPTFRKKHTAPLYPDDGSVSVFLRDVGTHLSGTVFNPQEHSMHYEFSVP